MTRLLIIALRLMLWFVIQVVLYAIADALYRPAITAVILLTFGWLFWKYRFFLAFDRRY